MKLNWYDEFERQEQAEEQRLYEEYIANAKMLEDERRRNMNKVCGLEIDFPMIEGDSERQIEYATNLREVYVSQHEDRFKEIEESLRMELDKRVVDGFEDGATNTFFENFTNEERTCLYGVSAGAIIGVLKVALEMGR